MKIKFHPASKEAERIIPPPRPASEFIPDWYKKTKIFDGGAPNFLDGEIVNKSIKSCYPFFDAYNTGYIQESWTDIYFEFDENSFNFSYAMGPEPISNRERVNIRLSEYFNPLEFIWRVYWVPQLENGYSAMMTHPLNRYDLPFLTTTGIIDSDMFYHVSPANYPFYIYKGFNGVIPAGTPLYQIIPIKRDSWKSDTSEFNEDEYQRRLAKGRRFFIGNYKRLFYQKKIYK